MNLRQATPVVLVSGSLMVSNIWLFKKKKPNDELHSIVFQCLGTSRIERTNLTSLGSKSLSAHSLFFPRGRNVSFALILSRGSQKHVVTCKHLQVDPAEKCQLEEVYECRGCRNSQDSKCPHPNKHVVCVCVCVCVCVYVCVCVCVVVG